MILDTECHRLYFADTLEKEHPSELQAFRDLLKSYHEIKIEIIEGTKDIWARDYMPVQIADGKFVSFRYQPWYLKDYEDLLTNRFDLPILESLDVQYSDINLDGGNVEQSASKVIITDRVFEENPNLSKKYLLDELERLFDKTVIIVRSYSKPEDMTGHIDGMMRFVNEDTLLVNSIKGDYEYRKKEMSRLKKEYGLQHIDIPFFEDPFNKDKKVKLDERISAKGIYVNYLAIGKVILLPIFQEPDFEHCDEEAIQLMKNYSRAGISSP